MIENMCVCKRHICWILISEISMISIGNGFTVVIAGVVIMIHRSIEQTATAYFVCLHVVAFISWTNIEKVCKIECTCAILLCTFYLKLNLNQSTIKIMFSNREFLISIMAFPLKGKDEVYQHIFLPFV